MPTLNLQEKSFAGARPAEVKADDAFLDQLTDHLDDGLAQLLISWRCEVRAGETIELVATDTALAVIRTAVHGRTVAQPPATIARP